MMPNRERRIEEVSNLIDTYSQGKELDEGN